MEFRTFDAEWTAPLVRFWSETFGKLHNAVPMTPDLLRRRIVEKVTSVEAFDPRGLILACESGRVRGMIHASIQPESICMTLDPDWPGGNRGLIMLLGVAPDARRAGIGTELWHRAMDYLEATRTRVIDGQCINPFYGNSEGPFTPFWGTPEGIALPWGDTPTKTFLAKKGYAPKLRGLQLGVDVDRAVLSASPKVECLERSCPNLGSAVRGDSRFEETFDFETAVAADGPKAIGTLVYYPMEEARPGLWGIYETRVLPEHQGQGVGKALLTAALERMRRRGARRCEVMTAPELSPGARELYVSFGFGACAEWAVY